MITVSELIEKLSAYPPDMPVILPDGGDGGGFNHAKNVEQIKVSAYSGGGGSYYGELAEYEAEKANMTYKKFGHGEKEFQMFREHFEALVIE